MERLDHGTISKVQRLIRHIQNVLVHWIMETIVPLDSQRTLMT